MSYVITFDIWESLNYELLSHIYHTSRNKIAFNCINDENYTYN